MTVHPIRPENTEATYDLADDVRMLVEYDLADDVRMLVELSDQIDALESQRKNIKARIAANVGVGEHKVHSVTVAVRQPNRRFNMARAWSMLTDDQKDVCTSPDAAKVKRQLAPAVLDTCMDEGSGDLIVSVR